MTPLRRLIVRVRRDPALEDDHRWARLILKMLIEADRRLMKKGI